MELTITYWAAYEGMFGLPTLTAYLDEYSTFPSTAKYQN